MTATRLRNRRRHGAALFEVAVSATVVVAVVTMVARIAVTEKEQQRRSNQEAAVLQALPNVLEELLAEPWDELSDKQVAKLAVPEDLVQQLADPEISLSVVEEPIDAADDRPTLIGKRVTVEISWKASPETTRRSQSLTTWVYRRQPEDKP